MLYVALRLGSDWVGGIGVAGAPGKQFDEACAVAGAQAFAGLSGTAR